MAAKLKPGKAFVCMTCPDCGHELVDRRAVCASGAKPGSGTDLGPSAFARFDSGRVTRPNGSIGGRSGKMEGNSWNTPGALTDALPSELPDCVCPGFETTLLDGLETSSRVADLDSTRSAVPVRPRPLPTHP